MGLKEIFINARNALIKDMNNLSESHPEVWDSEPPQRIYDIVKMAFLDFETPEMLEAYMKDEFCGKIHYDMFSKEGNLAVHKIVMKCVRRLQRSKTVKLSWDLERISVFDSEFTFFPD